MSLVEIKYFDPLIGNKPFFDQPVKNKQKKYEKIIEMSRNVDYNKKFIRLFKSWKILWTHWYRSIKAKKYECFPIVFFFLYEKQKKKLVQHCFLLLKSKDILDFS